MTAGGTDAAFALGTSLAGFTSMPGLCRPSVDWVSEGGDALVDGVATADVSGSRRASIGTTERAAASAPAATRTRMWISHPVRGPGPHGLRAQLGQCDCRGS